MRVVHNLGTAEQGLVGVLHRLSQGGYVACCQCGSCAITLDSRCLGHACAHRQVYPLRAPQLPSRGHTVERCVLVTQCVETFLAVLAQLVELVYLVDLALVGGLLRELLLAVELAHGLHSLAVLCVPLVQGHPRRAGPVEANITGGQSASDGIFQVAYALELGVHPSLRGCDLVGFTLQGGCDTSGAFADGALQGSEGFRHCVTGTDTLPCGIQALGVGFELGVEPRHFLANTVSLLGQPSLPEPRACSACGLQ